MPKSIFEIDVGDKKWQEFVASFNKFRSTQKESIKDWGGMDEAVVAIGAGFVFMTEELGRQAEATHQLAEAEAKRQKAAEDARKEQTRAEKEQADREKEAEHRRRKALQDTKDIAKSVADTAVSLGKWALFDLGAGMLTAWGLDRLVAGVGAERRLAQGFGVSTGERQAMSINMQRYFDVNSVLENTAETAADPSRKWVYSAMGVNPAGKDPAAVASEMAIAARRIFLEGHGNEQWAQAHGLLSIFSMDDLRRLSAPGTSEGQLRASANQARIDAAPGGHAFLDDEVSRKWQDFIVGLDMAGLHLKNVFVTKLASLEGPLSLIITKFADLGVQVLDRIDFKVLGDGLDDLSKSIASGEFQRNFKTVVDDIAYAANKLVGAMQLLHLLPDPKAPKAPSGGTPEPADDVGLDIANAGISAAIGAVLGPGAKRLWDKANRATGGKNLHVGGPSDPSPAGIGSGFAGTFFNQSNGSLADRNNNPGNIMLGGHYAHFATAGAGWDAMAHQLLIDYERHHQSTVRQLINDPHHGWANEWSPGNSVASTQNYIASVSRALGVSPDASINLHDKTTLGRLMAAMNAFERGSGRRSHRTHVKVDVTNATGSSVAAQANAASQ